MICEFNIILIVVFNFINQQFIYFWMGSKWITCFYPVYGIFAPFLRKAHAPLIVSHHLLYCLVQSTWVYNFVSTRMPLISSAIRYCSIYISLDFLSPVVAVSRPVVAARVTDINSRLSALRTIVARLWVTNGKPAQLLSLLWGMQMQKAYYHNSLSAHLHAAF
jgi:hypothetical protein